LLRNLAVSSWEFRSFSLASAERFLADYLVCVLVVVNFLCARFAGLGGLLKYSGMIRTVASYTFTLYLSHMLVISAWLSWYAHDSKNPYNISGITLAICFVTLVLAQVTERRKAKFRQPIDWVLRQTLSGKA